MTPDVLAQSEEAARSLVSQYLVPALITLIVGGGLGTYLLVGPRRKHVEVEAAKGAVSTVVELNRVLEADRTARAAEWEKERQAAAAVIDAARRDAQVVIENARQNAEVVVESARREAEEARARASTAEEHFRAVATELRGVQEKLGECYEEMNRRVRELQAQINRKADKTPPTGAKEGEKL